jgi:putative transposase
MPMPHIAVPWKLWCPGNCGALETLVASSCDWRFVIVEKPPERKGFAVLPKRWMVERTFAWLGKYRRLSKDYEWRTETGEAMIHWAMINRMSRLLASN